jgi:hypothetical protein
MAEEAPPFVKATVRIHLPPPASQGEPDFLRLIGVRLGPHQWKFRRDAGLIKQLVSGCRQVIAGEEHAFEGEERTSQNPKDC